MIPFIDWNGNGSVDPQDIALSLAIAEEEESQEEDEPSCGAGFDVVKSV